jgi:hypothetical protein
MQECLHRTILPQKEMNGMPFYVLGAPLRKENKTPYQTNLTERFKVKPSPTDENQRRADEERTEYLYRVLDRQINKARGLLTYDALLFTALNFFSRASALTSDPRICGVSGVLVGRILALGACAMLLLLLKISWGGAENYSSAEADFTGTLTTVWRRTYWVTVSLYVSIVATALAIWVICCA